MVRSTNRRRRFERTPCWRISAATVLGAQATPAPAARHAPAARVDRAALGMHCGDLCRQLHATLRLPAWRAVAPSVVAAPRDFEHLAHQIHNCSEAVVDLTSSGVGNEFGLTGLSSPVTIVFAPSGAVEQMFVGEATPVSSAVLSSA